MILKRNLTIPPKNLYSHSQKPFIAVLHTYVLMCSYVMTANRIRLNPPTKWQCRGERLLNYSKICGELNGGLTIVFLLSINKKKLLNKLILVISLGDERWTYGWRTVTGCMKTLDVLSQNWVRVLNQKTRHSYFTTFLSRASKLSRLKAAHFLKLSFYNSKLSLIW